MLRRRLLKQISAADQIYDECADDSGALCTGHSSTCLLTVGCVAFSAFASGCVHVDPSCTEAEAQDAFEAIGGVEGYMDRASFRLWHSHLGNVPEALPEVLIAAMKGGGACLVWRAAGR